MSRHECFVCGRVTLFYLWSTTRGFNVEKLMRMKKIRGKMRRNRMYIEGERVCFGCYHKLIDE